MTERQEEILIEMVNNTLYDLGTLPVDERIDCVKDYWRDNWEQYGDNTLVDAEFQLEIDKSFEEVKTDMYHKYVI